MSKCSCGVWNTDNAKYCRNCGKPLSQNQPLNNGFQSPQRQNSPQKINTTETDDSSSGWSTFWGILLFIGLVLLLSGIL